VVRVLAVLPVRRRRADQASSRAMSARVAAVSGRCEALRGIGLELAGRVGHRARRHPILRSSGRPSCDAYDLLPIAIPAGRASHIVVVIGIARMSSIAPVSSRPGDGPQLRGTRGAPETCPSRSRRRRVHGKPGRLRRAPQAPLTALGHGYGLARTRLRSSWRASFRRPKLLDPPLSYSGDLQPKLPGSSVAGDSEIRQHDAGATRCRATPAVDGVSSRWSCGVLSERSRSCGADENTITALTAHSTEGRHVACTKGATQSSSRATRSPCAAAVFLP
jgi:hypothetical protein